MWWTQGTDLFANSDVVVYVMSALPVSFAYSFDPLCGRAVTFAAPHEE